MDKHLSSIIAGLAMFLVFLLFKIEVSFLLCFIGLIFMVIGIQKYYDYKNRSIVLLSAVVSLAGLFLIYVQYKLDYIVMGLFILILVVLLISDFQYRRKYQKLRS